MESNNSVFNNKLCLESNNSVFNNKHFLQADGSAQDPHIRIQDDVLLFCPHSREDLELLFNYMKNIDSTKKIQFTMEVAKDILEILDLQLKLDKVSKLISVEIFSKATNSFAYLLPSTCFPKTNIENIPKGAALLLRRF